MCVTFKVVEVNLAKSGTCCIVAFVLLAQASKYVTRFFDFNIFELNCLNKSTSIKKVRTTSRLFYFIKKPSSKPTGFFLNSRNALQANISRSDLVSSRCKCAANGGHLVYSNPFKFRQHYSLSYSSEHDPGGNQY